MTNMNWQFDLNLDEGFTQRWSTLKGSLITMLRLEREERGMSNQEFSALLGISVLVYEELINGGRPVEEILYHFDKLGLIVQLKVQPGPRHHV